ncbi:SCL-interrupting locus protein homolog isoform X2 [Mugil cephalus]|uniref:SCL-interrupting locus protein homolog isoform X2 n=1 Tax=Mugil cephalus TaxID=48193 RepID=UPI001FB70058|nr:SCL-interrupting locus protein homolog isoform X2 [Mugil cephalus]
MSLPVNLQALPAGVLEEVFTPENFRGKRTSVNSLNQLSFPKSRSALWDGSSAGEKLRLHLCSHRKPRLVLLEKTLRLAHRHARHGNKPRLHCFLLGSVSVDSDEEGVTVTLDRFDPGRDQAGASGRVPSAPLPGDVLVPCLFSAEDESRSVVQSEAELHHCFQMLHQSVSTRQTLDLSQLLKVRVRVVCSQRSDAAAFVLSWAAVCPSVCVDVQPVRAVPIIPTALMRSLTSVGRVTQPPTGPQRGFLTMDQTRKLLLLLESDPKASNLPLVGLWLSGVTHVYNPQVWTWCLRFMFSSSLQDRVLSEGGAFLLVVFSSTHRAPQFFQCTGTGPGPGPGPGPGLQLDCQLLTASQSVSFYQVAPVDGRSLRCELSSDDQGRQTDVFRAAQSSFSRASPPGLSVSDQDSGVEDEDLSPRPSPSPHPPAQQTPRVHPSVPELSLLIDSSFSSNHGAGRGSGSAPAPPPPPPKADRKATSSRPPPHLHSTPNSNLQQSCTCCPPTSYSCTSIFSSPAATPPSPHPAPAPPPSHHHSSPPPSVKPSTPLCSHHYAPPSSPPPPPPSTFAVPPAPSCQCAHSSPPPPPSHPVSPPWLPPPSSCMTSDTYQLLLHQDRQLRLLQTQVQMLLEAQGKLHVQSQTSRTTSSVAVGTGASLFWGNPVEPLYRQEASPPPPPPPHSSPPKPPPSVSSSPPSSSSSSRDASFVRPVGGAEVQVTPRSDQNSVRSPVLGESVSMYRAADEQQSFYHNLMTQLNSRLQESDIKQDEDDESRSRSVVSKHSQASTPSSSSSSTAASSCASSSSSSSSRRRKQQRSPEGDPVVSATLRQLQQLGVDVDREDLVDSDKDRLRSVESASTLASINPAAVLSRLSVSEPTSSVLSPGGSVDLSLEANAIALRYLSDSQLSRLSLGGHAPRHNPAPSPNASLLSPSNMSLATRKYMRKYGLIEEEEEEEEEEDGEEEEKEAPVLQPLALNTKLLPQSQLIRDLRPKMQLLAGGDKENCSSRRPSLVRASSRQSEGSVGNILDLSRLRELPKLF